MLEQLAAEHGIGPDDLDLATPVDSVRDLVRSLLAFVRDGVGGERFVASSDIVEDVRRALPNGGHPRRHVRAGGDRDGRARACRARCTWSRSTTTSAGCCRRPSTTCRSAVEDTLDPHLIVQYPAGRGSGWATSSWSPRTRTASIYANDPPHRELRIAADLPDALRTADVFLLSSFNVIQDPATLESRLAQVRDAMRVLPPDALVMFEDAGYHVPALSRRVRDEMVWSRRLQPQRGRDAGLPRAHGRPARRADRREGRAGAARAGPRADARGAHQVLGAGGRAAGRVAPAGARRRDHDGEHPLLARRRVHRRGLRGDGLPDARHDRAAARVRRRRPARPRRVRRAGARPERRRDPTTIGLGDSFVGGFLAALDRR